MPIFRFSLSLVLMAFAGQLAAQNVQLEGVRISSDNERTRVVVDIDRAAEYSLFTLKNPDRVVVDIPKARFSLRGKHIPDGKGAVANIRAANRENGMARLVLDLSVASSASSFLVPPGNGAGNRLVIDLSAQGGRPVQARQANAAPVKVTVKTVPDLAAERDLIIAIDPGHGGKDPGALGRGGLQEKTAVLQISKRIATAIDSEPGMRSFLTRSDDRFLHLKERIRLSRKAGADLFISIHADSFSDRRVRGSTVYVLSNKGATDEAAVLLAKRENAADLIGGVPLNDKDDVLAGVLVDLTQNASLEASIEVGDLLIGEMSRMGKVRKNRVQQAGFRVLKSPDVPSLLVETAFISNSQDESNLRSVQYQQRLADAVLRSVRSYFYANPLPGTRVASLARTYQEPRQYVIRSGDTLSEIAERYKVSISRIRDVNRLSGSRIKVGQVLEIPPIVET
jgi:N-acetylmuramoyl-L-alanine amidase